ncbi:unnamed protein product [Rotaria sordida]|uniref:Uncharacterized protein n=1 Tax=Rotaria sordida TaxID=392033 RepID=A0A813U527_9BILA|nr:unnamed protein product [Rotaria sordida]CAF0823835.1 unnamed protein product [Rotaria sordida]
MQNSLEIGGTPTIHKDRSPPSWKVFLILSIVLVGFLFISTFALAIWFGMEQNKSNENDICLTRICVEAANNLLKSIDETIDPCENFYQFTCGAWLKNRKIPVEDTSETTFKVVKTQLTNNIIDVLSSSTSTSIDESHAIINARRLYASCIDEEAIEMENVNVLLSFINTQLGGWAILQGSKWNSSTFNILNQLLKLFEYKHSVIFNVDTVVDDQNSSANVIRIGQSDLILGIRSIYERESPITIAYRQCMHDIVLALTNDTSMINDDINAIFELEQRIAKYHWTIAEQMAHVDESIRTTLGNLSRTLDVNFDFVSYLRHAYGLANISLMDEDIVFINEIDFIRNVSSIINHYSPRTLQNYLVWRFVVNRIDQMPKRFQMIKQNFLKVFTGSKSQRSRTIECATFVNTNMDFAVAKLYIQKYFDENARNQSMEMIVNIRNTFIDIVQQSSWMDPISKSKAIEKVHAMIEEIGYPDYLGNDNLTRLETDYAEYNFNSSLMSNDLIILRLNMKKNVQMLREPVDPRKWVVAPTIIDATYTPEYNRITFAAGVLQMPAYHKDAPKYLNYGGIGTIIGHEVTHGFDDFGRKFDKDGNRIPWWTDETIKKFNERKQCIIDQYDQYTVTLAGTKLKMNGSQTQGENIADIGGLKEAFFAYQNWVRQMGTEENKLPGLQKYTPEQLFFINFGYMWCSKVTDELTLSYILQDVHSLSQFRVLGPTSNFDEFDRVFGCKPGQGNSRVNKCSVW